jgi:hypothetical protein
MVALVALSSAVAGGVTGGGADPVSATGPAAIDTGPPTPEGVDGDGPKTVEGVSPATVAERYNDVVERAPALIDERFADDPLQRAVALAAYERANDALADQVVELRVTTDDGETVVYTVTTDEDARIVSYDDGATDDETLRATTDEATLRAVAAADDPAIAALDAVERGDISVEATGEDGDSAVVGLVVELLDRTDSWRA